MWVKVSTRKSTIRTTSALGSAEISLLLVIALAFWWVSCTTVFSHLKGKQKCFHTVRVEAINQPRLVLVGALPWKVACLTGSPLCNDWIILTTQSLRKLLPQSVTNYRRESALVANGRLRPLPPSIWLFVKWVPTTAQWVIEWRYFYLMLTQCMLLWTVVWVWVSS